MDFCRTCMKQFSKLNENINDKQSMMETPIGYQNNIMELLETIHPQIKVGNDELPNYVCSDCLEKLKVSYDFIKTYQNAYKKLCKMLKKLDKDRCSNSSNAKQEIFEENMIEKKLFNKKIGNETLNFEDLEEEEEDKKYNDLSECEVNPFEDSPRVEGRNEGDTFNVNSESSNDDWLPEKSWLNNSTDKQNSDMIYPPIKKRKLKGLRELKDGTLQCRLCEDIFGEFINWKDHMLHNHPEAVRKRVKKEKPPKDIGEAAPNQTGNFKCEHCEKRYSRYSYYELHLRKHSEEPNLCIECGKSFQNIKTFKIHMLRHKGEKNYQCKHCPMAFVSSNGLNNHLRTHLNEKTYVCNTCGAAFHMACQLKYHNRYHEGIKNFQCEYCDMKFVTREKQQRHMRTHTGEKPYSCNYCEKAFSQSNERIKHLRTHLGENVYQCELCPLRFPLQRDLRAHFASHKDDDEAVRARNLKARLEEEQNLQTRFSTKVIF